MALESKQINASELDFDTIKANLKTYLKGQSEFSDYDFEGSGFSILLDLLSVNTHYNALYNNFAINELFLDSATKRNSVVSRANELGYIPHSASCAQAVVNIAISNTTTPTPPNAITLPKLTPFSSNVNGVGYSFYTTETITAINNGYGVYLFNNVTLKEGTPLNYKFNVGVGVRYIIPNSNVDLSTLNVRVRESVTSSTFTTFNRSDTILDVKSTSPVYFVKEVDNGLYELIFGDGVLGKELSNGNVIYIDYFSCKQEEPNGAKVFLYNGTSLYGGNFSISTVTPAYNGGGVESVDSIKYNAPKYYTAQNRAVTVEDYKTLIYNEFPEAKAVSVWGGEYNDPPVYGKTFICIKPKSSDALTPSQESYIKNQILHNRTVVSVTPEFVNPEFIKIGLHCTVYFNEQITSRTSEDIKTIIASTIDNYNNTQLQRFDGIFRQSQLSREIDSAEPSIINSVIIPIIRRELKPKYNISAQYKVNLITPIFQQPILLRRPSNHRQVSNDCVVSSGFYVYGDEHVQYLEDDGNGLIRMYYYADEVNKVYTNNSIGTVDYKHGIIIINNLRITAIVGDKFILTIKPESCDIVSAYTQMAIIDYDNLSINVIADKTANGNIAAGKNYIFTSTAK